MSVLVAAVLSSWQIQAQATTVPATGNYTNTGTVNDGSTGEYAVTASGSGGSVVNTGSIVGAGGGITISNGTTLTNLTNNGSISGGIHAAIQNNGGTIGTVTNSTGATLTASGKGFTNVSGTITALINDGTITSTTSVGLANTATIVSLTNNGTISASGTLNGVGLYNSGGITSLTNNGTITGAVYAVEFFPGTGVGTFVNAGTIAGTIYNLSSADLVINGATGTSSGTLTGYSGGIGAGDVGSISNTQSNVVFASGKQLLNDNVNVGTNTVRNTGAALQVNNPLTITGNFAQSAGASLIFGVGDSAVASGVVGTSDGYGRLLVSGSAVIASGSTVTLQKLGTYAFAAGQRFVVVQANSSGTNYNAGALNYSATGYTGSYSGAAVTDGANSDLVITLLAATGGTTTTTATTSPTGAALATDPNAQRTLKGLASYSGVSNAALLNLYNASLAIGTTGAANSAGKQLAPLSQAATAQAAAAPTLNVLNIVNAHADSVRFAQDDNNRPGSGIATGEAPPKWSTWAEAFGGHASRSNQGSVDGYSANFGGVLFGIDRTLSTNWRAGAAFSYANTAINNTGDTAGDSTRVNSYGLIGYGSYTGSPWYVNLSGGVVMQRYDTTRQIAFTGYNGTSTGGFGGAQYVARVDAGWPIAVGSLTVTPIAALTYSYLHQNSYTENGGNGSALTVGTANTTSVTTDFGARLSHEFDTRFGGIAPALSVAWRHDYVNDKTSSNARFAADPSGQTSFTTLGASPVTNAALISAGVTLLRATNLTLNARYDLQIGAGLVSQAGSLRLRQLF